MGWFGPGRDEIWRQVGDEIGGAFVKDGIFSTPRVEKRNGPWTLTLDTYSVHAGNTHIVFTRMRAPYVNPDGFRFKLYRAGPFSALGALLGMQAVEVGDPEFDAAIVLKTEDEGRARALFADPKTRALVVAQPKVLLEVKDDEGWFGAKFPENVDCLRFQAGGVIKDAERWKSLFALFPALLERLCRIGSAMREEPGVVL